MVNFFKNIFLFLILINVVSCQNNHVTNINLDNNWQFKQSDSVSWQKAEVPGCNFLDLYQHGIIEDPYFGKNETKLQWVGEKDWEYKTWFYGKEIINNNNIELVFEGLDTYADVYLNDSLLFSADNMFKTWEVDVKDIIHEEVNDLYIKFYSPGRIEKDKAAKVNYRLPEERGFTRKAPYQYGWDWGPKFITSGVWRPVYIRIWDSFRIENIQIIQNSITDSLATITASLEIIASDRLKAEISVQLIDGEDELAEKDIDLVKGINMLTLDFEIENPELWWPNGAGPQNLYELEFEVKSLYQREIKQERIGIRTIELVTEPDSIGESFYFKVNGNPIFMKGANYIPQDNFLSRVSKEKYKETIQAAVDANMNMLRVWGGGFYEEDIFYELCDEMGILVWQDFMFACNMYPGDEVFLKSVKEEAIQNVKRLRNHPSIALWCGNNEISEGWYNWGWQKSLGYSEKDSLEVWNAYLNIFEGILPEVVSDYDGDRSYWPSSPSTGWGHEQALYSGDMHYWGVWWGEEPFEIYEKKVGRFMSEYGFQGFPAQSTLDSCLLPEDKNLISEELLNHQKHPRGMELIRTYMERDYKIPNDFEHYAYVSQLVQAYGIKTALEAHRRAMPYCMGTLYWQLNDCWPVISWSSVDYYDRWKALHYFTRDIFKDYMISFEEKNEILSVFVVSDKFEQTQGSLEMKIFDFNGNEMWSATEVIIIPATSSEVYYKKTFKEFDRTKYFLNVRFIVNNSVEASDNFYFSPPKELQLSKPNIIREIEKIENGYSIKLSSDKLAKNVFLSTEIDGFFAENYFDLLPGEKKEIIFKANAETINFEKDLKIISLIETL